MPQREHSAILSTFIKLPFVYKTFVLSFFKWSLKTGFSVHVLDSGWRYGVGWGGDESGLDVCYKRKNYLIKVSLCF